MPGKSYARRSKRHVLPDNTAPTRDGSLPRPRAALATGGRAASARSSRQRTTGPGAASDAKAGEPPGSEWLSAADRWEGRPSQPSVPLLGSAQAHVGEAHHGRCQAGPASLALSLIYGLRAQ